MPDHTNNGMQCHEFDALLTDAIDGVLSGTALGWLASQAWRRPAAVYPTGVVVWLCTVFVGMLLRKVTAAGVAGSFVVVASTVTALLLLGWRAAARAVPAGRA